MYDQLATDQSIAKTVQALKNNGIEAIVMENGDNAKKKVLGMVPQNTEVMTMSSVTLDTIGVTDEINTSDKYISVRNKLYSMDREKDGVKMSKLGAAPEWTVGSVQAVTEDGKLLIASNTGSQLPAYAYSSNNVIWVIGAQKIVKNTDEGIKRIYEYVLPLESDRAHKAYGVAGSFVSKLLIINKEINPNRHLTAIIVRGKLGF